MEEELVVLDEELCRIIKEVEKDYAAVTKVGTKLKRNQRENKIEDMLDKLQTGRGTYSLYHGQLKELVHEGNSSCVTKFKDKGHQYNQTLQKLAKQVKLAKDQLAKEPLLPGDRDRKDMNTWGADEIIEEGARVQDASKSSLARSQRLVESAEALGLETNEELHKQSDTIKDTTAQVAALSAGLDRADRILMHIARRLATDKMILCLVLLLVLAILALIIAKGLGVLPGDGGSDQTEIDCRSHSLTSHWHWHVSTTPARPGT